MILRISLVILIFAILIDGTNDKRVNYFNDGVIKMYREKVRKMFYHAYDGYLTHAFPLDELKPISCQGQDTWGSFSLSLVDALDTLLIMGNKTEFKRAIELVLKSVRDDENVNVSVFETNIRVVGGLITAHMLAGIHKDIVEDWEGWPCDGPLLKLAVKMADRLLPAFNTETGMPYGTVNLRYGVHRDETPITCTAGVGTFIIEFGTLSRLTGDDKYEKVALKALDALWSTRSTIGLVGNHINVVNGKWTATDSGIGAGVDSYFEYLAKGAYLFKRPSLMKQFEEYVTTINKHVRKDDWFMWVSMTKGTVSLPIFQSLEAFWPGTLTMVGDVQDAQRIMLQYSEVIRQYGFPPEFYNIHNSDPVDKRAAFPLRPEMAESLMYLYRATNDKIWLELGAEMIDAIESSAKTKCGYATINNVKEHNIEDRMESFFLAETTKYLYLLFDPSNFIHNDGKTAKIVKSSKNLTCAIYAGGYIFNTEAHPVDPGMLDCCSVQSQKEQASLEDLKKKRDFISFEDIEMVLNGQAKKLSKNDMVESFEKDRTSSNENRGEVDIGFEVDEKLKEEAEKRKNKDKNVDIGADQAIRKVMDTLVKTHLKDEENRRNGEVSDNARELVKKLQEINPNLTTQIVEINREAMLHVMELSKIYEIEKIVEEVLVPVVYCNDCCYPMDEIVPSISLRVLMAEIYEFHFYPKRKVKFERGPLCWIEETPKIEDNYKNEPPMTTSSKWQLGQFDDEHIDTTDFLDFDPSEVEHLGYKHLLSPSYSFLDQFTGGGHIALRRKSSWYYTVST